MQISIAIGAKDASQNEFMVGPVINVLCVCGCECVSDWLWRRADNASECEVLLGSRLSF